MQFLCCGLLLLLTVTAVNCKENCPSFPNDYESQEQSLNHTDKTMKYEIGKVYTYKLNTEVQIVVDSGGSDDENESFSLEAIAKIRKIDDCEFCLKLGPIRITSKSGTVQEFNEHSGNPSTFFYKNFRLGFNMLHENRNDSRMTSSIKRAVISMLQTSTDEITVLEGTDVIGTCLTMYTVLGDEIMKDKNIKLCEYRLDEMFHPAINLVLSTISLKNFVFHCTHTLKDRMVEKAECFESYEFDGMYNTRAAINSSLHLVEVQSEEISTEDVCTVSSSSDSGHSSVSSGIYDHTRGENDEIIEATKTLLEAVAKNINSKFDGSDFLQNVFNLTKFTGILKDKDSFHKIQQKMEEISKTFSNNQNELASTWLKELFFEALSKKPSHAIMEYIAELVKKGTFLPNEKFLKELIENFPWLRDLFGSRIFSSAANMMKLFQKISLSQDLRMDLLNFISWDVYHAITMSSRNDRQQSGDFKYFIKEFESQLKILPFQKQIEAIRTSEANEEATKNFASLCSAPNNSDVSSVDELYCVRNAFRHCHPGMSKLLQVFKNVNKPSDVRIQAYMTIAKCAYEEDHFLLAKRTFENPNEDSDVLGFIASYVENNPLALPYREILEPLIADFKQRHPTGRILSKYFKFNFGKENETRIILKADVVFSKASFIPSGLNIEIFKETKNGQRFHYHNLGIFTSNLETFLNKILHNRSSNENIEGDGEILIYLRHMGRTDYFRKFSVKELENMFVDLYKKVIQSKNTADWLQILLEDKNLQNFLSYTYLNDDKTIYTAGGIPISWRNNGKAFIFSSLTTEGLQNWDSSTLSLKVKTNPKIGSLQSQSVVAGFENYEIGIEKEAKVHSALNLQFSASKTNHSNLNMKFDVPLEKIFSLSVSDKIFYTNFINYKYESHPLNQAKIKENIHECISATVVDMNYCYHKKCISQVERSFCDFSGTLSSSLRGISLDFNNLLTEKEKEISLGLNKIDQTNETSRISDVYFQYTSKDAKEDVAVGIHSPWINSDLKISGVNTDALKELDVSFMKDGNPYTALLYYKKIDNPENADDEDEDPDKRGVLCTFPFYWFCNVEYDILAQFSSPAYSKPLNILEITVTQDYGKKINFNVSTGGPFKAAQGSVQAEVSYSENISEEKRDYKIGTDIEVIYQPIGGVHFYNSWEWEESEIAWDNTYFAIQWNSICEYGRHENPNKDRIHSIFKFATLRNFSVDGSNEYTKKESISHELRSTQFPSPFLNFNVDMDKVSGPDADSRPLGHEMCIFRISPYGDVNRQVKIIYENKRLKWESFSAFLVDQVFSVSHQGSLLSLKTSIDKKPNSIISDILWELNWRDKYVSKLSILADSTARERILTALVKVQNYEYQFEKNRLMGNNTNGEQKVTMYKGNLIEKSGGNTLLSYVLVIESEFKYIIVKLKNEKYLEYQYQRKAADEDFQLLHKLFIKDLADGNGILKLNTKNKSPYPVEIQIDTKFLPTKMKVAATFIVELISNDTISLDTNIKWRPISENNLSGKINGKAEFNYVIYILDALYDIRRPNHLSQLKIHGNANNTSGTFLSCPDLEINLKTSEENIFEFKYQNMVHKSSLDLWQFKFHLQNEAQIDITNAITCQREDKGNEQSENTQYVQGATIVMSKNGLPLSLIKFPSDIDLHFNGNLSFNYYKGSNIHRTSTKTFNGKANYTSGGGIIPKKELIFTADVDIHPSNDTEDYNSITENSDAFYTVTKLSVVEDATLTRDFNGSLKLKMFPTSYGHYSTSKIDESGQEYEKTVFYVDHNNKYQAQLNYSVNAQRDITDNEIVFENTIQGSSDFITMFESWSDFEFSQKQWIKIPYFSEEPKEWETEIAYKNEDNSGTKLILRQSDAFVVGLILDTDGLCEVKAGVDIKDYESGFLINFNRKISWKNIQITSEIITLLPFLKMGRFSVNHSTGSPRSSFLVDINENFEINGYYYLSPEPHYNLALNISDVLDLLFDMTQIIENERSNIYITLYDRGEKSFELRSRNVFESGKWNVTHYAILNGTFIPAGLTVKASLIAGGDRISNSQDTSPNSNKEYISANLEVIRKMETGLEENVLAVSVGLEGGANGSYCHQFICYHKSNSPKHCAAFSLTCQPFQLITLL